MYSSNSNTCCLLWKQWAFMAKFIKALPNLCAVTMCSYERGGGYVQILSYSKEEMKKGQNTMLLSRSDFYIVYFTQL